MVAEIISCSAYQLCGALVSSKRWPGLLRSPSQADAHEGLSGFLCQPAEGRIDALLTRSSMGERAA